jgi:hypothetical protein
MCEALHSTKEVIFFDFHGMLHRLRLCRMTTADTFASMRKISKSRCSSAECLESFLDRLRSVLFTQ